MAGGKDRPGTVRSVALAALLWMSLAAGRADELAADQVKAGFVLNFSRYTEWPQAHRGSELRICGLDRQALSGKLQLLAGRQVEGRPIRVLAPVPAGGLRDCQVLFIAASEHAQVASVLRELACAPVLTVSDMPDFIGQGGMIGLKLRAGRVRFDINRVAVRDAGLHLSSQLLKLADEVLQ